jgi:hypothetical protein
MGYTALKIGAIAVKQYGWYYTIVYRGGVHHAPDAPPEDPGECYDVVDTTIDQIFRPDAVPPPNVTPNITRAVNETWRVSLRKFDSASATSRFFMTGYRAGEDGPCGFDANGFRLMQASLMECIHDGLDFEQTLRVYLDPRLEIVKPGAHNVIGTLQGDGAALALTRNGSYVPHIYAPANGTLSATSDAGLTIQAAGLLGTAAADMTRDGYDDLLTMSTQGGNVIVINVAHSDRHGGYGSASTWWRGDVGVPAGNAQMLIGDYNADAIPDVGILVSVPNATPGATRLVVVIGKLTGPPLGAKAQLWWRGLLNRAVKPRIFAGDVNGDGGADLLVMQPYTYTDTGRGTRLLAMLSSRPANMLGAPTTWFEPRNVGFATSAAVMGDFNRDGKDDLAIAFSPADGSTHIDVVRLNRKHVKRYALWNRPSGYPVTQLRLASADVDLDGMSDLVLFRGLGKNGTQIVLLHAGYTAFTATMAVRDPKLNWKYAKPF